YNPPLHCLLKWYCLVHFVVLLAIFFHFEHDRANLSYLHFSIKIAFFIFTMQCFSAFFDLKSYAPFIEVVRCATVIVYYFYMMKDDIGVGPNRLFMLGLYALSAAFWSAFYLERVRKMKTTIIKSLKNHRIAGDESATPNIKVISGDTVQPYPTTKKFSPIDL
uniref:Very-long-chain 3-oxoacyl-CoA synthase n=1 Tax=Parascaris univalens TaxID=6257 RepID=A0A915CHA1_PARUN